MIQVMPGTKVYLACRPVSMRYGFDGLAAQVKQVLAADPFSGHLFLFRSMAMVKTVARATSLPQTKNRGQRLTLTQQPFPLPQVGAQRSHFGLWPEAGAQQTVFVKALQPLRVADVGLPPRHVLGVPCIDHHYLEPALLQDLASSGHLCHGTQRSADQCPCRLRLILGEQANSGGKPADASRRIFDETGNSDRSKRVKMLRTAL